MVVTASRPIHSPPLAHLLHPNGERLDRHGPEEINGEARELQRLDLAHRVLDGSRHEGGGRAAVLMLRAPRPACQHREREALAVLLEERSGLSHP